MNAPTTRSRRRAVADDALPLAGFAAATTLAALAGMRFAPDPRHPRTALWYAMLRKGRGNPPPIAFPIVWTALYGTIAVAGWRVWRQPASPARTRALAWWAAQLGLNAAWTPIFFGAHRPRAAFADLAANWGAVAAFIAAARDVDEAAAWLMAPYLAWVSYAAYLNEEIVRRNR